MTKEDFEKVKLGMILEYVIPVINYSPIGRRGGWINEARYLVRVVEMAADGVMAINLNNGTSFYIRYNSLFFVARKYTKDEFDRTRAEN